MKPTKRKKQLNPGSDKAVKEGCTCAVLDNARGKGIDGKGKLFWINGDCPIHGGVANKIQHQPKG